MADHVCLIVRWWSWRTFPGSRSAHTLTHPDLRRVSDTRLHDEVSGSRDWLQNLLGREVQAFCYPKGLHDSRAVRAAAAAGFRVARTTWAASTTGAFDPLRMPTTQQVYPHERVTQLRHAAKEKNLRGLWRIGTMPWFESPTALACQFLASMAENEPAVVHFWGHSWELEALDLWTELDALMDAVHEHDLEPLTNSALVDRLQLHEVVR
jgi:hypothetical protein